MEEGIEFSIGEMVILKSDSSLKPKVYVIYSYTTYWDGRVAFMLWSGDDYDLYEPWQLEKYNESDYIGFNTTTNEEKPTI